MVTGLDICKKRLELAKAKEDSKEIKFWTERIARRLLKPQYANYVEEPKIEKEVIADDRSSSKHKKSKR